MVYKSRSFVIGFSVAIFFTVLGSNKFRIKLKHYFTGICSLSFLVMVSTFYFKVDSSAGRMLIYKLSIKILKNNWVHGVGLNKFKATYMEYQSNYFMQNNYSIKEFLLADNTYFAFNEYLQLIIEIGILGIPVIIFAIVFLFYISKNAFRTSKQKYLVVNAIAIIITILTASLFNYVLHIAIIQLVLLACILFLICKIVRHRYNLSIRSNTMIFSIALFFLIAPYYHHIKTNRNYRQKINDARQLNSAGFKTKADSVLSVIPAEFHTRAEYLEIKSGILIGRMELDSARVLTETLLAIRPSNEGYLRLGTIHDLYGNHKLAEFYYQKAIYMVPNRFLSRFQLYGFFKRIGQKRKAKATAKKILSLPIKIPSSLINQIKSRIREEI